MTPATRDGMTKGNGSTPTPLETSSYISAIIAPMKHCKSILATHNIMHIHTSISHMTPEVTYHAFISTCQYQSANLILGS